MKKIISLFICMLALVSFGLTQGTLQFNQAKIVSNSQVTVPSGKVWKVTSVYGSETACLDKQMRKM